MPLYEVELLDITTYRTLLEQSFNIAMLVINPKEFSLLTMADKEKEMAKQIEEAIKQGYSL